MKRLCTVSIMAMLLSLLSACSMLGVSTAELDTQNKRIYAAELAVETMLNRVDVYQQEGRFDEEEWKDIKVQLRHLDLAYQALETDVALGRSPEGSLETIFAILYVLRDHVEGS